MASASSPARSRKRKGSEADPQSPTTLPPGLSQQYLSTEQTALYIGVSVRTLEDWRRQGTGPDFAPLSAKLVRYRVCDVDEWFAAKLRKDRAEAA